MNEPASPDLSDSSSQRRKTYLGILCLLAFSFMVFQIAILRELRFQLTTLFTLTPFLFSAVIVCIALGSLCASRIRSRSRDVLRWGALVLPILVPLLFAATIVVAQRMLDPNSSRFKYGQTSGVSGGDSYLHSTITAFVAVAIFGYGFVFFLQGLVFSLYFREGRDEGILSDLYGADLVASGIGALAGGALNFYVSPPRMVMIASGVLLVNLWVSYRHLGSPGRPSSGPPPWEPLLIAAELGLGSFPARTPPLAADPNHLALEPVSPDRCRRNRADLVGPCHWNSCFRKNDRKHQEDFRRLPSELIHKSPRPIKDVLIIGGGSGADVRMLRDLVGPELKITAVELDRGFVDAARAVPWLWEYYRTADIIVQEGRYYLENTRQDFDLVLYAFIDP
jgi:hypothetical protein